MVKMEVCHKWGSMLGRDLTALAYQRVRLALVEERARQLDLKVEPGMDTKYGDSVWLSAFGTAQEIIKLLDILAKDDVCGIRVDVHEDGDMDELERWEGQHPGVLAALEWS